MDLDRVLANAELAPDLLIQQPRHEQLHHLPFARSEGRVTIPDHPHSRFLANSKAAAFESLSDGGEEHVISEGLLEKLDGPRLYCFDSRVHVKTVCNEDD